MNAAKIPEVKTYAVYLNGQLTITEDTYVVTNPANGEAFARMCTVPRATVAQAIKDAHAAFIGWRQVTGKKRGELLRQVAAEVERRRDEIARLITLENGKPLTQSLGEVALTIDHLTWFAEEARRGYGRIVPPQTEEKRHLVFKTPIGVVGAISPWNFPLTLAVRKVAPALAAGCTVVLKPASKTPLSSAAFAECVDTVKLPKGVFQLVVGSASEIGKEFLENPLCKKITFTGSTEVGKQLIEGAAKSVKPLSLELGGHAPVIVFEDADLDVAVNGAMLAKFRNSGQSCIAANRIYVQRSIYQEFLKLFVEKVRPMNVGDGLDPQSQIGALIDEDAVAKATEHVEDAVRGGARLLCGGKRLPRGGFFFEATVLADVPKGGLCMYEETFAPIAPVCPFDTEEEAIREANNSPFGLSAYAFTRDLSRMFRLAEGLETGLLGINDGLPTATQAPFGGVKQSGWGRELGIEGMESFLETKHVSIVI
ncbi:MAG TPA: NAD-dependent succinate-semialdehyde dehydrogenase [Candidatus Dormibacteraeota bacterium]|nr:NAD-dependent succinate-semialdehyde dehydrogenase [Candidatus Dormibacteraeota bacterium]